MSLLLLCGLLLFWLVLVVCCWAFLVLARVFSSYSEFIQGDLCLSAHTAPVPVQKKEDARGALVSVLYALALTFRQQSRCTDRLSPSAGVCPKDTWHTTCRPKKCYTADSLPLTVSRRSRKKLPAPVICVRSWRPCAGPCIKLPGLHRARSSPQVGKRCRKTCCLSRA